MLNETSDRNAGVRESVLEGVRNHLPPLAINIEAAIGKIEANWSKKKSRSEENWRLLHVPLKNSSDYSKRDLRTSEVLLERTICDQCQKHNLLVWNQMPAASGLLPLPPKRSDGKRRVASEGRRAIDLVHRPAGAEDIYEFLELKIQRKNGSVDSLQHATLEVLEYGLLYLFSRHEKYREKLGYTKLSAENRYVVLDASEIRLRVLATEDYYKAQDRINFSVENINTGLEAYIANNRSSFGNLKMNFGFEVLGSAVEPYEAFIGKSEWQFAKA